VRPRSTVGQGRGSISVPISIESRIPTYVKGLDERLGGGIPRGHIALVSGPPGSLKSTFAFRILYKEAIEHGASGLYLSMEQSRGSLVAQMSSFGMDAGNTKNVHVIDVRALRREIEEIRDQPRWLLGLRRQLTRYKEEVGCDLLVLDSLDALYALTPMDNPRNEVFHFFEELREVGATAFLVSEMARDATSFAHYGVEEFLADTIVHLRLREIDIGMSTSVRRYIGVVKMRGVDHDLDYFPLLVEEGDFEIVSE
jgi:KaiC/GvpD/RAD55 family RecA-like ATPase